MADSSNMPKNDLHHVIIGDAFHPDCPHCQAQAASGGPDPKRTHFLTKLPFKGGPVTSSSSGKKPSPERAATPSPTAPGGAIFAVPPPSAAAFAPAFDPHLASCPCRFCQPHTAPPLAPWEDEIIDIRVGQPDGSIALLGSYRVEQNGSITWLTADGLPPKSMLS